MSSHDIHFGALGFAVLMIVVAVMTRADRIEHGDVLLTLLPALSVTTFLAARGRRSCAKGC